MWVKKKIFKKFFLIIGKLTKTVHFLLRLEFFFFNLEIKIIFTALKIVLSFEKKTWFFFIYCISLSQSSKKVTQRRIKTKRQVTCWKINKKKTCKYIFRWDFSFLSLSKKTKSSNLDVFKNIYIRHIITNLYLKNNENEFLKQKKEMK